MVSILVVVDWALKRVPIPSPVLTAFAVSILVVVDWALKPAGSSSCPSRMNTVSILVVVDWALKHGAFMAAWKTVYGFNPCCCGLGSEARAGRYAARADVKVSILVVVDWALKPNVSLRIQCPRYMFQSLLLWIGL